jgi:LysM repeat protein
VQPIEDAGLLPPVQTPPARLPRSEPQPQRQELPGYVVAEDEQDALETEPVRHRPRPRRPLRPRRQQRLDQSPQLIVHDPRSSTHTLTNGQIITPVTASQQTSPRSCNGGALQGRARRLVLAECQHQHRVKGDTLSGIGKRTGVAWATIAALNGLKSPYTNRPGQKLELKASAAKPPAFPGTEYFRAGANNAYVTQLGSSSSGRGTGSTPRWAPARSGGGRPSQRPGLQLSQHWSGSDADGYPGPETWKLMPAAVG